MMDTKALQPIFNLAPKDAIDYLKKKGIAITFDWEALSQKAHQVAFTVAGVLKLDVLTTLREHTLKAIQKGMTFEDYKSSLGNRFAEAGFSPTFKAKTKSGKEKIVTLTPSRLENIFRTNIQSAYNSGRLQQQQKAIESSSEEMFYLYNATLDKRTRPSHKKLDGLCLPVSDPIWKKIYPPNGFRCRCSVSLISATQAKRLGVRIRRNAPSAAPDKGFEGQPTGDYEPDLKGYDGALLKQFKKEQGK